MNYFSEGNKYYAKKEYSKAISYYQQSIDIAENVDSSSYNAGVCYIKLKDYYSAILMLKNAIIVNPLSKYYFNLAYCYAMTNILNKALIYFNMAWSLDNNDSECEKAINLILSKCQKLFN